MKRGGEKVPESPKIDVWLKEQDITRGWAFLYRPRGEGYVVRGGTFTHSDIRNPPDEFEVDDDYVHYHTDEIGDAVESLVRISECIREEQFT
jgi:hypothetical protein